MICAILPLQLPVNMGGKKRQKSETNTKTK